MKTITESSIKWLTRHTMDLAGFTFSYCGAIYRVIRNEARDFIEELFQKNIIAECMEHKYLIQTQICSDIELKGYEECLILEHAAVPYISYSHEWSYEMFCAAFKMVIDFDLFLLSRGYELRDPHPGNVGFIGCMPVYLDLGSITVAKDIGLAGILEIQNTWLNPLKLMMNLDTDYQYVQKILSMGEIKPERYAAITGKGFMVKGLIKADNNLVRFIDRAFFTDLGSARKGWSQVLSVCRKAVNTSKEKRIAEKKKILNKYKKIVQRRKRLKYSEDWTGYQSELVDAEGQIHENRRLNYYIEMIREISSQNRIVSLLEIAGNSGVFTEALLAEGLVKRACVTDYDAGAIDEGFIRCRRKHNIGKKLSFALLNIMDLEQSGRVPKQLRFQSDIVMMLAVTHHLLLTQKVRLNILIDIVCEYVNRYLIIEFMPLGLWYGGPLDQYKVPDWYTLDWFLGELKRRFTILKTEEIQTNRIAILAEKKDECQGAVS